MFERSPRSDGSRARAAPASHASRTTRLNDSHAEGVTANSHACERPPFDVFGLATGDDDVVVACERFVDRARAGRAGGRRGAGGGTAATARPGRATPWPVRPGPRTATNRSPGASPRAARAASGSPVPSTTVAPITLGGEMGDREGALDQAPVRRRSCRRTRPTAPNTRAHDGRGGARARRGRRCGRSPAVPGEAAPWTAGQNRYGVTATRSQSEAAAASITSGQTGPTSSTNRRATSIGDDGRAAPDQHAELARTRVAPRHASDGGGP